MVDALVLDFMGACDLNMKTFKWGGVDSVLCEKF